MVLENGKFCLGLNVWTILTSIPFWAIRLDVQDYVAIYSLEYGFYICHNIVTIMHVQNFIATNSLELAWNFHGIWIMMERSFVKWTLVFVVYCWHLIISLLSSRNQLAVISWSPCYHSPVIVITSVNPGYQLYINGLVQDGSNSSTLAMELLQSCPKPSYGLTLIRGVPVAIDKTNRAVQKENACRDVVVLHQFKYLLTN